MSNIEKLRDLIIYQSQNNENMSVEVLYDEEDFWLTQKSMSQLFNIEVNTINYHLKEVFRSEELNEEAVIRKIRITANDGKKYNTNFYSLDAIIAVGYRVNSKEATAFRIWATNTLKEYIKKGFVLNDELLKNGPKFGKDYFKELLERIRSIRASERRIWQQITDIFAECSIDYDKDSEITHQFYAMIQNKFHFAITGSTAAEIIYERSDHKKENMGLTTWKNAPDGRILKSDVMIAKNYLEEKQIKRLERAVTAYFDYIEDLVERENTFTMEEFSNSVNEFLEFRKYNILKDNGKISRKQAEKWAKKYNTPMINKYEYNENPNLKIKNFVMMTEEWLDFIIDCRSGKKHEYDIVIGAMADDQVYNYITDLMAGEISREAFWELAKFRHPTHQIAFCTDESLKCINFIGVEEL